MLDALTVGEALHNHRDLVRALCGDELGHVPADDFISRVAVELLGGRVPAEDDPVHVLGQDGIVGGLHDRREACLDFLGAPALREITNKPAEVPVTSPAHGADGQLDREFAPVATERCDFDALPEDGTLAGAEKVRQSLAVRLTVLWRNYQIREGAPDRFRRPPAENGFRLGVPAGDPPIGIHCDDSVERRVKDSLELILGQRVRAVRPGATAVRGPSHAANISAVTVPGQATGPTRGPRFRSGGSGLIVAANRFAVPPLRRGRCVWHDGARAPSCHSDFITFPRRQNRGC